MALPDTLTATAAMHAIRSGTLAPLDLVEAYIDRIAAREPDVRAFAFFDPDLARQAAASANPEGPLRGLPLGVKDVLNTGDMPTAYGSPIWAAWQPRGDCAAVAWAKAAGAVVMGKTVTTEFATRKPGPTTNPHNARHTPGGSSSGSAAGVAAGFFPFALGTQTAGSVIRPAAYCGVVGYKPSFGTIARGGMKIMSESLDTIGAFARSVADCALLVGAASGRDLGDPERRTGQAPRVGVCRSLAWDRAPPETQALLSDVADRLARAGAAVAERDLPAPFVALEAAHPVVMNAESARSLGWELATAPEQISEQLRPRLEFGLAQSDAALAEAYATFARTRREFPGVIEEFDVLLTPAAPGEAPEGLEWTGDPVFNYVWTSLRVPCVSVPAGLGPRGLPLGVQIVGRFGDDRATLAWAQWIAAALA